MTPRIELMVAGLALSMLLLSGCSKSGPQPNAGQPKTPTKDSAASSADAGTDKAPNASQPESSSPADFVFTGGKVYTVDGKQDWAEAVAVKGNKITFVGSAADAKQLIGDETKVIDCKGKTVMPGFVSAHDHLIASSWTALGVNLYDAKDKAETLKLIKEYAEAHPDEDVIRGVGWVADKLGGHPTAKELDAAVPNRPAILLDFTIHDAWLSSKALEKANITKDTPDTLPGVTYWVRDDDGNPTGCAIEIQWMKAYIDMGAWDAEKMVRESCDKLFTLAAQNGTTAIIDPDLIKQVTLAANKAGLHTVIHTDGSATGRAAVDACEAAIKAGHKDMRNAIHHFTWFHPDDYQRVVDLKIPANATPNFYNDWSNQAEDAYRLLGKERTETMFGRYTDLPGDGVKLSLSADVPSTQPSMQAPLFCVEGAATLMDPTRPGESKPFPASRKPLTVEQAIRAVTIDAAWQLAMDDKIGSLEVGKLADIVVLEKNPFEVKPTEIAEIDVQYTMMDGRFTHMPESEEIKAESKDKFLDSYEFTPKTSAAPTSKEMRALTASLEFASRFCCDRGHAGCDHE